MRRLTLFLCLLSATLFSSTAAHAQRLFVLVAGDVSDEIVGDGVRRNMEWICDAFRYGVPKDQLIVRFLAGEKLTPQTLLGSIANCPVTEDDAIVVWWLGRGDFDEDQRVLLLPNGTRMTSSALRDQLVAKMPRLAVVVIDAYARTLPAAELPERTMEPAPAVCISPVFQALFFEPSGIVEIDSAQADQRPLLVTTTGGLLTCGLLLPPGVLGDVDEDAGFLTLRTPTGDREVVLERGVLWQNLSDSVEWDTVLSQVRSKTSANYRRAMGRKHIGSGQTPTFNGTRLKYADHFVEWHAAFAEFRSRPRESRVRLEGGQEVTYQGESEIARREPDAGHQEVQPEPLSTGDHHDDASNRVTTRTAARPAPEQLEIIPGDHLLEVNGHAIRNARQFDAVVKQLRAQKGEVRFTTVDNQSGRRIHYRTQMTPGTDADFGIKPWYWNDSLVVVHDIRPGSPAARAQVVEILEPKLPAEVGLGIRGRLIEFDDPLRDHKRLVGVMVESVTAIDRCDLKPGDIVFSIDGYNFANEDGYRFALKTARQLAGLWIIDGQTGGIEHRHVLLPHAVPQDMPDPPQGAQYFSITPADIDSCPIW